MTWAFIPITVGHHHVWCMPAREPLSLMPPVMAPQFIHVFESSCRFHGTVLPLCNSCISPFINVYLSHAYDGVVWAFVCAAETERQGTDHLDLAGVPQRSSNSDSTHTLPTTPESRKKSKGIKKLFGKWVKKNKILHCWYFVSVSRQKFVICRLKRSQSTTFNLDDNLPEGEFKRGGVRATAGPRLGWSRDFQRVNKWVSAFSVKNESQIVVSLFSLYCMMTCRNNELKNNKDMKIRAACFTVEMRLIHYLFLVHKCSIGFMVHSGRVIGFHPSEPRIINWFLQIMISPPPWFVLLFDFYEYHNYCD